MKQLKNKQIEKIHKLYNNEYTIVENYIDSNNKLKIKHNECGTIYTYNYRYILSGKVKCSECDDDTNKSNTRKISERINTLYNGEYEVVGKYINSRNKIAIKHKKCGKVREYTVTHILSSKLNCITCRMKEYNQKKKKNQE